MLTDHRLLLSAISIAFLFLKTVVINLDQVYYITFLIFNRKNLFV